MNGSSRPLPTAQLHAARQARPDAAEIGVSRLTLRLPNLAASQARGIVERALAHVVNDLPAVSGVELATHVSHLKLRVVVNGSSEAELTSAIADALTRRLAQAYSNHDANSHDEKQG